MEPKIAILLLNWNNAKDSLECLTSVFAIDYPNFEVLVTDNGSSDGSLQELQRAFPQAFFLPLGKNLGFAEGNNRAIEKALERGAEFILLLNNDTVVCKDLLSIFEKSALDFPQGGVFGAKILYYDDPATLWSSKNQWSEKDFLFFDEEIRCADYESKSTSPEKTDYVCGCALFIRKEAIEKAGLMEKRFFLLWEETDWCERIKKAGFSCFFVPDARVWHKVSSSFIGGRKGLMKNYFFWRNRLLFLERNLPFRKLLAFYSFRFFKELISFLYLRYSSESSSEEKEGYRGALLGIRDYFFRRFGAGAFKKKLQG